LILPMAEARRGRRKPRALRRIPFYRPWTDEREITEAAAAIRSGWLTTGPRVALFEERLARYVGARHAVAVNSCTAALHLSLAAAGVGRGDEVITSPYTFAATGEAILYLGARPVFADIRPDTLAIDPDRIARAVTRKTRAIIPVHIAGLPCEMGQILALARRHGLTVIEDAAHALGSRIGRRKIGSMSRMTCFSFYATKNLTTGEGGMVTTGDAGLAARLRRLSLHGLSRDAWRRYARGGRWRYDVVELGYKYNMTDVAAALGLVQLAKFPIMQSRRRRLALRYTRLLADQAAYELPRELPGTTHAWHLYILRVRPGGLRIGRDHLVELLRREGIGTSVHFTPLHLHSYYRRTFGYRRGAFPITERESARAVSLPLHPGLSEGEQDRIVDALRRVAHRFAR
jgi:dTDP-4-amino-4,6-dideoxygalactose transaminase